MIWTDPALADLEAIADYIARAAPRQASLVVQRAFRATDRLRSFLVSGASCPTGIPLNVTHLALRDLLDLRLSGSRLAIAEHSA